MTTVIDGKVIAGTLVRGIQARRCPKKYFAAVLIGDDERSFGFLNIKKRVAAKIGVDFRLCKIPTSVNNDEARRRVREIVLKKRCGGALVQLPLPEHLNSHYVLNVIPRDKDVEVLGERALGAFYAGRNPVFPPSVGVVKRILELRKVDITKTSFAVIGAGVLVGKPISVWLTGEAKTVTILEEGGDLEKLKHADVVISGTGVPGLIDPAELKDGAGVIDFGYGTIDGALVGDLKTSDEGALSHLSFYTPTPGGTGPILIAQLFENFYILAAED